MAARGAGTGAVRVDAVSPTRIPLRKVSRIERFEAWCDRHSLCLLGVLLALSWGIFFAVGYLVSKL